MISPALLQIVRCPTCREEGHLEAAGDALRCAHCGESYPRGPGYLDLVPRGAAFEHTTHYVADEEAFAAALDYRTVGPPLLAAGVRQRLLRRMLQLERSDRVLDCGCGNAKFALWNHDAVALLVGLDPATLFADAALAEVDLVQGDARRMPFAAASFDKAFSIDVFEHLTLPDLEATLDELHRLLRPGGRLLIYSNTREPSSLQPIVSLWRRIGRFLRRRRPDPDPDALRKADHVKAVATYEELQTLVEGHGFRIVDVRFWNSVVTSFVEHVLMAVFSPTPLPPSMKFGLFQESGGAAQEEQIEPQRPLQSQRTQRARRFSVFSRYPDSPYSSFLRVLCRGLGGEKQPSAVKGETSWEPAAGGRGEEVRATLRQRAAKRGPLYWAARVLTWWMGWDMTLFSRLRSGSYFLLLERP